MLKFNNIRIGSWASLISAKSLKTFKLSFLKLHTYPRGVRHCQNPQQRPRLVLWSSENITLISHTSWTWLILDRRDGNTEQAATRVMRKAHIQHSTQPRFSEVRSCANMKSSQVQLGQGNGYPQHGYLLAYIPQELQRQKATSFSLLMVVDAQRDARFRNRNFHGNVTPKVSAMPGNCGLV